MQNHFFRQPLKIVRICPYDGETDDHPYGHLQIYFEMKEPFEMHYCIKFDFMCYTKNGILLRNKATIKNEIIETECKLKKLRQKFKEINDELNNDV